MSPGERDESATTQAELEVLMLPMGIKAKLRFLLPGTHSRHLLNIFERLVTALFCLAAPIVTVIVAATYHLPVILSVVLLVIETLVTVLVIKPIRRTARRKH